MIPKIQFPFTAIVGQEDFKLCLLLNLIDPMLGGVLVYGDKGTGKTTTIRALSQLMGADFPFVNLPIGATEDRVLGHVNLEVLFNEKRMILEKGLLAKANRGFLYVDEINLLNDYLMDSLLDASASGGYHLEREGISEWLESRFCLVGSMNPEEGELRPQLVDRFGLSVEISSEKDLVLRKEITKNRLAFDLDAESFYESKKEAENKLKEEIISAKERLNSIIIPEEIMELASKIALEAEVEGLRADILLLKTARAYTALKKETEVSKENLERIKDFVLNHRAKNKDSENSNNSDSNNNSLDENQNQEQKNNQNSHSQEDFQLPENVLSQLQFSGEVSDKKNLFSNQNFTQPKQTIKGKDVKKIDLLKTIQHKLLFSKVKIHYKQLDNKANSYIVFLVDCSSSMAIEKQISFVKGLLQNTLEKKKFQKISYALVAIQDGIGKIIHPFTQDWKTILELGNNLKTKGKTNLGDAFLKVKTLIKSLQKNQIQLFVFTDGKINHGNENPETFAKKIFQQHLRFLHKTTVVDTENDFVKLGKAKDFAEELKLDYVRLV
ncbi:AAA family ATPase [Aureivirga sp. CE67]|uniref:AAA family ATPase n=1 Tax=Aureivirga sp. CE67 TaxID=1788983 RepID=UPI0018CA54C0|nr:AAA family ATPase [Aureivirga sp. CE67]